MANTSTATTLVGNYVRSELEAQYRMPFRKRQLQLAPGGMREFNAVSDDTRVVASIKYSGGRTSSGQSPAAKIQAGIAELYFLSLIDAERKLLILTTPEFHTLFREHMQDKIASGIDVVHLPLPAELQAQVATVHRIASAEMSGPAPR